MLPRILLSLLAGLAVIGAKRRNIIARDWRARLDEQENKFRTIADNTADGVLINIGGRHVYANRRVRELLGFSDKEMHGVGLKDLIKPDEYDGIIAHLRSDVGDDGDTHSYETNLVAKDGTTIPVEIAASKTVWQGHKGGMLFVRDISARKSAEETMHKLSRAIDQTADVVFITNRDGCVEYVNPAFEKVTGYRADEVIGKTPDMLKSGKQGPEFYANVWKEIQSGNVYNDIFVNKRKHGGLYYQEQTITPLTNSKGDITHFVTTGRDITERMEAQEKLQFLAQHDALTRLPNRALFLDRLNQSLARARWHDRRIAVIFMDLDRFKTINDSLGHGVGDALLTQVGERLLSCLREGDTVARLGGDEFVILLNDVASEDDVTLLVEKLLSIHDRPFSIDGHELYMSGSVGVSLYPGDGEDSGTLMKHADIAMYRAKESGKNNFKFFSADMSEKAFSRLTLEHSLRRALENSEYVLLYQPIVNLKTNTIVGAEALLRWQDQQKGIIFPGDFVPLLEETGLIQEVGEWVLHRACRDAAAWSKKWGAGVFRVSVNISGRQIGARSFLSTVNSVIRDTGLAPAMLELEITESVLMHDLEACLELLRELHARGIKLSIDDFGTGYSSLSYLKRLPIQTVKIDRSFIADAATDSDDNSIVEAAVAMAHGLKLNVIAEGVENMDQLAVLKKYGCDEAQGYLFSRAVSAGKLSRLVSKRIQNINNNVVKWEDVVRQKF